MFVFNLILIAQQKHVSKVIAVSCVLLPLTLSLFQCVLYAVCTMA
jgi:hypothetical protein